ncbi:hypothetical protein B0H15DRAFT_871491 [Mycena belliarum]|uniref:Uncharacterized protein n=1 Tax=Mycena belliarum TaxID=1033014 RepID=A0AAD6XDV3_9AGAR|nr:hypothetical protein B0H15DRAFT_871491 [Mycena belliae]
MGSTREAPQTYFLRPLLGLNPRSMLAVIFTETSLMPIRHRHTILALRYGVRSDICAMVTVYGGTLNVSRVAVAPTV